MNNMIDIHITCMRHPKILISRDYCYGQSDVLPCPQSLNEIYQENKQWVKKFDFIASSPLTRCARLAKKFSNAVYFDDRIKEINFGEWEMKKWEEIGKTPTESWREYKNDHYSSPGGESFINFKSRIAAFLKEKEKNLKNALLITHSGVIRILSFILENQDSETLVQRRIAYGEKVSFKYKGKLHLFSDDSN